MIKTKQIGLFVLCVSLILSLCACATKDSSEKNSPLLNSENNFSVVTEENITLTNNRYSIALDTVSTHFTVTDIENGNKYTSVPDFECSVDSQEVKSRFKSELVLQYFDDSSTEYAMYSTVDSVQKGGVTVLSKGNTIRIIYKFLKQDSTIFAPKILSKNTYDKIFKSLSSSQKRRLKLYYTLYSSDDKPADYADKVTVYPVLKKGIYYLLNDSVSKLNMEDINSYMSAAHYTKEDYKKLLLSLGISEADGDLPGFTVPVEYTLTEDGFTASILSDMISEESSTYKLGKIELLPFYAACDENKNGWFFIPDGSGAIINMNTQKSGNYNHSFYGEDASLYSKRVTMLMQNQYLPVFGEFSNGGYFAIVEKAAAVCELNVQTKNPSSPSNSAWISYNYRTVDYEENSALGSSTGSASGKYNLYSAVNVDDQVCIRYILLNRNVEITDMADIYRNYLTTRGNLVSVTDTSVSLLDFTCILRESRSFCGVPYTKKTVLTTISQITQTLRKLYESKIEDVSVRLLGYTSSGMNHGLYNKIKIDKSVGSEAELMALKKLVEQHGGRLYLEADFMTVGDNKIADGFLERNDSAYYLNKQLVHIGDYNVVTRDYNSDGPFLVSALKYSDYAEEFLKSLGGKESFNGIGVSYKNTGSLLGGSYSRTRAISRISAVKTINSLIDTASKQTAVLMGGGNLYALSGITSATDISLVSSFYDIEESDVPFWQMVMHGMFSYTANAYNSSNDPKMLLLRSVASGSGLHFSLIGKSDDVLLGTALGNKLYSMNSEEQSIKIINLLEKIIPFYKDISKQKITDYKKLSDNVYMTGYENGCFTVVNYSDSKYIGDGFTVDAKNYYMGRKD